LGAEFCELGRQIAKVTAFLRSAWSHGLGVEEQSDGTLAEQPAQAEALSVLIRCGEVGDFVTFSHETSRIAGLDPTGAPPAARV
jgi:hypothetical protein